MTAAGADGDAATQQQKDAFVLPFDIDALPSDSSEWVVAGGQNARGSSILNNDDANR